MLGPSTATRLRKMIASHTPRGGAPLESGLGAGPTYADVTIAILGDYYKKYRSQIHEHVFEYLSHLSAYMYCVLYLHVHM